MLLPRHSDDVQKCSVAQLIMGCFAFNSLLGQASSRCSPAPTPTVLSNSKSNMAGRINDRQLQTLVHPKKTPALLAKH